MVDDTAILEAMFGGYDEFEAEAARAPNAATAVHPPLRPWAKYTPTLTGAAGYNRADLVRCDCQVKPGQVNRVGG